MGIVLEYFQPILRRIDSSLNTLRRLIVDISVILDALHGPLLSAVHADIKYENIMYSEVEQRFKLVDYGNCTPLSALHRYRDAWEIQSLLYRAPEVLLGVELSPAMDIWSFGVVLLQWTSDAQLPFMATDRHELALQIAEIMGPFPETFRNGAFYRKDIPLAGQFEQPTTFWKRWRGSNIARLTRIRDAQLADLLARMLECNPSRRLTALEILKHPFVAPLVPIES